jgi:predicted O-methyltransferase YrrM
MQMKSNLLFLKFKRVIDELCPLRKIGSYQKVLGMIAPEEGKALQMLIEISKSKNVLEIGAGCGFSALWMSKGLIKTGGSLITIEIEPKNAKLAKENIKKAKVENIVTLIEGDAVEVIPNLKEKFDIVFLDAIKMDNLIYFDLCMQLVKVGG